MSIKAYHFVGPTLRDGRQVPADGEWLEEIGSLEICRKGLHASKHVADAVRCAPGTTLCLVELDGDIKEQEDKICASRRRIIARFDATALLRADARASALSVIHLWKAPAIIRQYLETGDDSIRQEAGNATYAAADAAANAYAANAYAADAANAANAAAYAAYAAAYAADAATYAANAYAAYAANAADAAAYAAAYAADAATYAADAANAASRRGSRETSRARLQASVDAEFAKLGV